MWKYNYVRYCFIILDVCLGLSCKTIPGIQLNVFVLHAIYVQDPQWLLDHCWRQINDTKKWHFDSREERGIKVIIQHQHWSMVEEHCNFGPAYQRIISVISKMYATLTPDEWRKMLIYYVILWGTQFIRLGFSSWKTIPAVHEMWWNNICLANKET